MSQTDPTEPVHHRGELLGHPKGLFLLFLVEMWERFSYYGMRGLLVLYLVSVFAVNQLQPGVYTNVLEFQEQTAAQTGGGPVQERVFQIAVSQPGTPPTPEPAPATGAVLKVQRAKQVPAPTDEDPDRMAWVPDETDDAGPIVISGQAGAKEFTNETTTLGIWNPTDQPVRVSVGIRREDGGRTYFRVNNNPDSITTEIKPDAARAEGEDPFIVTVAVNDHDSGRNWTRGKASVLYGWYTGLAYLFPIFGGLIADKLIGTHRSMLIGGILIAMGHVILGLSGMGDLAYNPTGMAMFIMGLAVIVMGTGHFKPCVSVMVGQLYKEGDPRRDGAFTIFYMGINLGAFICAFVCGTLGERVGWHWGFGSAAVGMLAGLTLYMWGRPVYLRGIGEAPRANANAPSLVFFILALVLAAAFAAAYHAGLVARLGDLMVYLQARPPLAYTVIGVLLAAILAWVGWFLSINRSDDRGPVITIFVFMFFNAFFWIAFEQAGSSINLFTEQNTNRNLLGFPVPATWFQSVNAGLIFILAPFFAAIWTALGKRHLNPSQPVKIALGLIFLGLGYVFMVLAGKITVGGAAQASMFYILATYFWHTVGELCLSPTGLSYVTKAAPKRFVALLMGIWFISSFIANLGGGLIAAQVEAIERGEIKLPWSFGGQADFFALFVVFSVGPGLVILALTPMLKKLVHGRES